MKEIRVGFIGTGVISHRHMANYEKIPGIKVVACCDIDKKVLDAWGEKYGIPEKDRYTDYRDLLARDDIDTVDVCVHNNLHAPLSIAVMRAGKHCFCEKPMAASYIDAKTMYEASKVYKKELAVQVNTVFTPTSRIARKMVEAGELGKVYYARSTGIRRRGRPGCDMKGLSPNFYSKEVAGHGALFDMGIYHISQLLYILGLPELERVSGSTYQEIDIDPRLLEGREFGVEELGLGFAKYKGNLTFEMAEAWAINLDTFGDPVLCGSKGGFRFYTDPKGQRIAGNPPPLGIKYFKIDDENRNIDIDLGINENIMLEQSIDPTLRYRYEQHAHWYAYLQGIIPERIQTQEITLKTAQLSEGIFLSGKIGREVTADEIDSLAESTAMRRQETEWGVFEYDF